MREGQKRAKGIRIFQCFNYGGGYWITIQTQTKELAPDLLMRELDHGRMAEELGTQFSNIKYRISVMPGRGDL